MKATKDQPFLKAMIESFQQELLSAPDIRDRLHSLIEENIGLTAPIVGTLLTAGVVEEHLQDVMGQGMQAGYNLAAAICEGSEQAGQKEDSQ